MISGSRLRWLRSRCSTITKARPLFGGRAWRNPLSAAIAPAEPPIPMIGLCEAARGVGGGAAASGLFLSLDFARWLAFGLPIRTPLRTAAAASLPEELPDQRGILLIVACPGLEQAGQPLVL